MLGANQRHFFVEALRPPHDYELDEAIATTYSLDLTSLLTVPVHLAFAGLDPKRLGAESAIALLEALRRTASKIDVYADAGHIALPSSEHLLYGMLERLIVPARGPNGGALHSKLWVLRYRPLEEGEPARLRVLVLSRNLTNDRSWDVSLVLEGAIGKRNIATQRELGDLVTALPSLAIRPVTPAARERAARLGDEARRAQLEVPAGFESVRFHAIGLNGRAWFPEPSDRLLVVSPFVTDAALRELAESTQEPVALVSRSEGLDPLEAATISRFGQTFVLHQQAEGGDGDADLETADLLRGLHAKVLLAERGWHTHLYVGSANATNAALLSGRNIEVMAELIGKTSKVKGIDSFLGEEGLGPVLVPYTRPDEVTPVDPERKAAEDALENARVALVDAKLRVRFEPVEDRLRAVLIADHELGLEGIRFAQAWLVTMPEGNAVEILGIGPSSPVELATCAIASSTGLLAIALTTNVVGVSGGLVLNLTTEGLPASRNEHIVRLVIDNRDRFLAYLVALLSDLDEEASLSELELGGDDSTGGRRRQIGPGLLEQLVRAKARRPERLDAIREMVDALMATEGGKQIVPEEFMAVWLMIGGVR